MPNVSNASASWRSQTPTNDMAWFSLGTNLHATGAWNEAAEALRKCVDLNPGMSRGWELLGASLIEAGDADAAAEVLEKGHAEASSRGDLMPVRAMEDLLSSIGREPPRAAPMPTWPRKPSGLRAPSCANEPENRAPKWNPPIQRPRGHGWESMWLKKPGKIGSSKGPK